MREILFRGKRTDTGEWVEGYYEFGYDSENEEPTHYMWVLNHTEKYGEMFIVIPETVGQYTGITDSNGKKVFEGDIVIMDKEAVIVNGLVKYQGAAFCIATNSDLWDIDNYYALEVIRNIHDNPELISNAINAD